MLITLTSTPYQKVIEKIEEFDFDVVQMSVNRKRTEEGKKTFSKQMCVLEKRALP